MTRLNKFLFVLLLAQLALGLLVVLRSGQTVSFKEELVLPGFDIAAVSRLQIYADSGDKPALDLVKRGNDWVMASHFDYPVDVTRISAALTPLAAMKSGDPIATQASRHKQLRVDDKDFERKLVISSGGKDTTLFLGGTAALHRIAVRRAGEDNVLAAGGVSTASFSTTTREWISKIYSEVAREDIDKIAIQHNGVTLELDRSAPAAGSGSGKAAPAGAWRASIDGAPVVLATGETLDSYFIDSVVSEVSSIDAAPADPKRDAPPPTATITITRKSGGTVVLVLVTDGDGLWVKRQGMDRATRVDMLRFEQTLAAERSRLITKPVPGSGSGSGAGPRPPKRP